MIGATSLRGPLVQKPLENLRFCAIFSVYNALNRSPFALQEVLLGPIKKLTTITLLSGLILLLSYQDANAYLDPATGSYIFQLLLAALLGAALAVKIFWSNVKYFFLNLFSKNRNAGPDQEDND